MDIVLRTVYIIFAFIISANAQWSVGINLTVASCVIQYSEVCASDFLKFYISTSDYPEKELFLLKNSNPKLPKWIDIANNFKIIIHGYGGGGTEFNQTKDLQKEYLKVNSVNVISVDWGRLVSLPCYPSAALNTKQAGNCISEFLEKLHTNHPNFIPWNIHIIGFSLGAHVAGFASNSLEKLTGKKIQRITGLDPALPLFATPHLHRKLDLSDAEFVDVIHTQVGVYGKIEPSGHADFYINGGQFQPNCYDSKSKLMPLKKMSIQRLIPSCITAYLHDKPLCSHLMAITYFIESIASEVGFWGVRCSSYFQFIFGWCGINSGINSDRILMGEHCSKKSYGIVFLSTNLNPPYAMGKFVNNTKERSGNSKTASYKEKFLIKCFSDEEFNKVN